MSYPSLDSDEFGIFSSSSCSPGIDTYDSLEKDGGKDETQEQRNSTPLVVNDHSLYQTMFSSDMLLEKDVGDVQNSGDVNSLDKEEWNLSDFITSTSSQPNLLSYDTVSPASSQFLTVSWNSSETTVTPTTVSWNTSRATSSWNNMGTNSMQGTISWNKLRTSSAQGSASSSKLETISTKDLDDENSLLLNQDDDEPYAVERVSYEEPAQSFDEPTQQPELSLAQSASKFRRKSFDAPSLLSTSKEPKVGLQNINNQCYVAAINEYFGRKKHSKHGQYISKVKNSKPHSIISQVYDKLHKRSPGQSPVHKQKTVDTETSTSPTSQNEKSTDDINVTKTTFSTFTTPSIPSPLSPYQASAPSPSQSDGQKSPKVQKGETETKKYRYNQTALALQQSGLMKTTIKTAELLRKSRLLQQELSKLRKETSIFVHMVLNNPENKHLKDMYMSQINQDDTSDSKTQ